MLIKKIIVGPMEANCYIISNDNRAAAIIDPGADYHKINNVIRKEGFLPQYIILTHGHGDHIGSIGKFDLPIWIHRGDAEFLTDPSKNLSGLFSIFLRTKPASKLLEDKELLKIGELELEVIHTPGHTPGSICINTDKVVFTGDTLFCGGVGRTDFPYGSEKTLFESISKKLLILSDDTIIYPGHGPSSTIGEEKKNNPFLI